MAVPPPPPRLRPLTVAGILDEAFNLYRANFTLLAGVAMALVLPSLLMVLLTGGHTVIGDAMQTLNHPRASLPTFPPPSSPFAFMQYPVQLALLPFQAGALLLAAGSVTLGVPISLGAAFGGVVGRYWALMALALFGLVLLVAWLCLPLGIWLTVRLALAVNVLLVERAGVGRAIERSWQLTDGVFWRTFAVLLLAWLLQYVLAFALLPVFAAAAALFPGLTADLRGALLVIGTSLVSVLVQPLFALAVTLIYFDRRVRREALDLELIAYGLQSAPSGRAT